MLLSRDAVGSDGLVSSLNVMGLQRSLYCVAHVRWLILPWYSGRETHILFQLPEHIHAHVNYIFNHTHTIYISCFTF